MEGTERGPPPTYEEAMDPAGKINLIILILLYLVVSLYFIKNKNYYILTSSSN